MYYAGLSGMKRAEAKARTAELLGEMNLSHVARRTVGGFSKGMARRVAIAAALVASPELLVLDEPTSGLDPIGTREVKELVGRLAAGGMTVLLTSHQLFDVQDACSRIAVMSQGRKVGGGTVAEIVEKAKDKRHALEEYFEERLLAGKGMA
jgi:ABC-2 type transport system ATP-binding protein